MRSIYIGPNIPALGMQQFRVYKSLPVEISSEKKLSRLCVPVENLCRAREALAVQGSPEWTAYRAAIAAFLPKKVR